MENHDAGPAKKPAATPVSRKSGKGLLWGLLAVVLAFMAGFGWQFYRATQIGEQLEQAEAELRVERVRVGIAQAALAAQAGDFERARSGMSDIFTRLQQTDQQLPPDLRVHADAMLERRDEVITGLSRSNPAYVDVLYDFLRGFSMMSAESAEPAAPAPADTADSLAPSGAGTGGADGGG